MDDLKKLIREIPDYPKPGILFYDLTTLLKDGKGFHDLVDKLCDHYEGNHVDYRRKHRSARVHLRAGSSVSPGRGLRPRAQAEKTSLEDRFGDISA